MFDWRKLPAIFEPALSRAYLAERDHMFWLGDGELRANDQSPQHWHDTYEIGLIHHGSGILSIEDREYPYSPGLVYIIDDGKPHMCYSESPRTSLFVIHFQSALLWDSWVGQMRAETQIPFIPEFAGENPLIPLDDPFSPIVTNLLYAIREEGLMRSQAWEVVVAGLILQAMGHLTRRLLQRPNVQFPDLRRREALQRIRPILHLIESSFAEPLTLDDMARAAYLSRSHCCALFQLALNTTPVAYRNQRRLSEARRLLLETNLPVRTIAFEVGFSSAQELNRLFLRENHVTPTQFRQRFMDHARRLVHG
jgi:AraC family transcriptional activator of pobA